MAVRLGEKSLSNEKNKRTHLTPTGLLMEGDYTNYGSMSLTQSSVTYNRLLHNVRIQHAFLL